MNLNKIKFNSAFVVFLTIAVMYAIGNFIWWKSTTLVLPLNEFAALHFHDIFVEGYLFYNAPFLTYIMRFMFFVFGKEYYDLIIIFVNYIFFLVPLYFIYKIGVELKNKETGNIAMILFAFVPAIYAMSRRYGNQDYHIIAPMTFGIYCLIKTDYFKDRKWSIWYGISVGLGLMTRDVFIGYFSVPFLYIVIASLKDKIDKPKIINILISICTASLIAGWHYFRYEIMIKKVVYDAFRDSVPLDKFENLRITTIGLWEELLSPPIFILFIISLIFFIYKYRGKYKNIILLWFIVPWCIITFMPHYKISEYELGFVPAVVLMCAVLISYIKIKHIKFFLLTLLFSICFLQYISFSFYDIELFNLKFNYKGYLIKYFNNDSYYSSDTKTIELVKYLKNRYFNNKFYFIDIKTHFHYMLTQMWLNDMYCRNGRFLNYEVFFFDIIIFRERVYTADEIFNFEMRDRFIDPVDKNMCSTELINFMDKRIHNIFKRVNENYYIIDIFYLDTNKAAADKVILFGRKDKFPQFFE